MTDMEDLKVHETNPKVSEESSASVLGAMLPTVPPEKTILKKEGMIDMIPEELMEFIYDENATYTYAVEGAIANIAHNVKDKFTNSEHGKDLKTNSLPFKVRQLTIERATLKVKISWMGKRKSKQEKIAKYKARLVEVEQALRKIQNSVNNAADKKEMERQIKELDKSVVKQTSKELEERGMLEAVNEFIAFGKEAGFIESFMEPFTREELYPVEDEILQESPNVDMLDAFVNAKMKSKKAIKRAKKAIKKQNYVEASKYINEIKGYIKEVETEVKNYPRESASANLIGMVTGWILFTLVNILKSLGIQAASIVTAPIGAVGGNIATKKGMGAIDDFDADELKTLGTMGGFGGAAGIVGVTALMGNSVAVITNIIGVLRRFKANLDDNRKKKKDLDLSFINGLYNRCLVYLKDTGKALDKLEKDLKKADAEYKKIQKKEKEAAKETKESVVEESELSLGLDDIKTLVESFESDLIDESSYLELLVEAKKPDDGMMDILNTLNRKGYKTKYSCSGHKDSGKADRNEDGIVNGKLTSAARIMFGDDYDFPDPPKHWGFKTVEGKDYLYVLPYSSDGKDPKAFDAWKNKYMASLSRWADNLPEVKTSEKVITKPEENETTPKEKDVTESVDIDSSIDNELMSLLMDMRSLF